MGPRDYKPAIATYVCYECNGRDGQPCRLSYEKYHDSETPDKFLPCTAGSKWEVENDPTIEIEEDT